MCLAAVYAKGETALLQAPDEAFAGGTALLVPLEDAGVLEHVAEDDADLLVQDVEGVLGGKLIAAAREDVGGPIGVARGELVRGKACHVASK